ncbi:MAG: hypothetical protein FWD16_06720, partial [Clostridia bacterium]|nr:hypothetical protein [Clostridia bacterium]
INDAGAVKPLEFTLKRTLYNMPIEIKPVINGIVDVSQLFQNILLIKAEYPKGQPSIQGESKWTAIAVPEGSKAVVASVDQGGNLMIDKTGDYTVKFERDSIVCKGEATCSITVVDKGALRKMAQACEKFGSANPGVDTTIWSAMRAGLAAANVVLNDTAALQPAIDAAVAAFKAAHDAFIAVAPGNVIVPTGTAATTTATPAVTPTPPVFRYGDIDCSGRVDIDDILLVRDFIFGELTPTPQQLAEIKRINKDGAANIDLILAVRDIIFGQ